MPLQPWPTNRCESERNRSIRVTFQPASVLPRHVSIAFSHLDGSHCTATEGSLTSFGTLFLVHLLRSLIVLDESCTQKMISRCWVVKFSHNYNVQIFLSVATVANILAEIDQWIHAFLGFLWTRPTVCHQLMDSSIHQSSSWMNQLDAVVIRFIEIGQRTTRRDWMLPALQLGRRRSYARLVCSFLHDHAQLADTCTTNENTSWFCVLGSLGRVTSRNVAANYLLRYLPASCNTT